MYNIPRERLGDKGIALVVKDPAIEGLYRMLEQQAFPDTPEQSVVASVIMDELNMLITTYLDPRIASLPTSGTEAVIPDSKELLFLYGIVQLCTDHFKEEEITDVQVINTDTLIFYARGL